MCKSKHKSRPTLRTLHEKIYSTENLDGTKMVKRVDKQSIFPSSSASRTLSLVLVLLALIIFLSFAVSYFVSSTTWFMRIASIEAQNLQVKHIFLLLAALLFVIILVSLLPGRLLKIGFAAATLGLALSMAFIDLNKPPPLPIESAAEVVVHGSSDIEQVRESSTAPPPIVANDRWWRRGSAQDAFWAAEVLKGGYILHFRHAHRDMDNQMFGDTVMFDALDMLEGFRGLESPYHMHICLNEPGKRQAKAAGEIFKFVQLPVQVVVSSPSCRAVETANLAFGRIDQVNRALHLRLLFDENGRRVVDGELQALFQEITKNRIVGNIVLVGHNGTLGYLGSEITIVDNASVEKGRAEMGFTVISLGPNREVIIHHEFKMLRHFVLAATANFFDKLQNSP